MLRKSLVFLSLVAVTVALILIGCSTEPPLEPESPSAPAAPEKSGAKTALSAILVPDSDVPYVGWPGYPGDPAVGWSKIDEGVANLDYSDIVYAMDVGIWDLYGFTDISGYDDIDVSEIEFTIPLHAAPEGALSVGIDLWYYIDGNEEGYARYQCGDIPGVDCGDTTWVVTFDDICYDLDDINSLELKIKSIGTWWYPQMTQIIVYAIDAEAKFDEVCTPVIEDLEVLRHGNNFAIVWDTDCEATSEVIWGYSPTALNNKATSGSDTHHIVNFSVAGNEGCVYLKAISAGLTCSAPADTSDLQTNVKDVVISNVVRSFNALTCEMQVTWTTNVKSSSKVYWGPTCSQLNNIAIGGGNTTSHTVKWDATGITARTRVYSVAESATSCDSAQSSCGFVVRNYCISQ